MALRPRWEMRSIGNRIAVADGDFTHHRSGRTREAVRALVGRGVAATEVTAALAGLAAAGIAAATGAVGIAQMQFTAGKALALTTFIAATTASPGTIAGVAGIGTSGTTRAVAGTLASRGTRAVAGGIAAGGRRGRLDHRCRLGGRRGGLGHRLFTTARFVDRSNQPAAAAKGQEQ